MKLEIDLNDIGDMQNGRNLLQFLLQQTEAAQQEVAAPAQPAPCAPQAQPAPPPPAPAQQAPAQPQATVTPISQAQSEKPLGQGTPEHQQVQQAVSAVMQQLGSDGIAVVQELVRSHGVESLSALTLGQAQQVIEAAKARAAG